MFKIGDEVTALPNSPYVITKAGREGIVVNIRRHLAEDMLVRSKIASHEIFDVASEYFQLTKGYVPNPLDLEEE